MNWKDTFLDNFGEIIIGVQRNGASGGYAFLSTNDNNIAIERLQYINITMNKTLKYWCLEQKYEMTLGDLLLEEDGYYWVKIFLKPY